MKRNKYNKEFYTGTGSNSSAGVILPLVIELIKPKNAIDIGCGIGAWLSEIISLGVDDILGIDGSYIDRRMLLIPETSFKDFDLRGNFSSFVNRRFDLAMSVEVAEHIENEYSKNFISNLVKLSDCVLFSAAIPFQGGTNHFNENWPEFWASVFLEFDYYPLDYIRSRIWNDNRVACTYRQNILLFIKKDTLFSLFPEYDFNILPPLSLVHPEMYLRRIGSKLKRDRHLDIEKHQILINSYMNRDEYPIDTEYYYNESEYSLKRNLLARIIGRFLRSKT